MMSDKQGLPLSTTQLDVVTSLNQCTIMEMMEVTTTLVKAFISSTNNIGGESDNCNTYLIQMLYCTCLHVKSQQRMIATVRCG